MKTCERLFFTSAPLEVGSAIDEIDVKAAAYQRRQPVVLLLPGKHLPWAEDCPLSRCQLTEDGAPESFVVEKPVEIGP